MYIHDGFCEKITNIYKTLREMMTNLKKILLVKYVSIMWKLKKENNNNNNKYVRFKNLW